MRHLAGGVRTIVGGLHRGLLDPASIAGAAAASGDPAPLLTLDDGTVAERDSPAAAAA